MTTLDEKLAFLQKTHQDYGQIDREFGALLSMVRLAKEALEFYADIKMIDEGCMGWLNTPESVRERAREALKKMSEV